MWYYNYVSYSLTCFAGDWSANFGQKHHWLHEPVTCLKFGSCFDSAKSEDVSRASASAPRHHPHPVVYGCSVQYAESKNRHPTVSHTWGGFNLTHIARHLPIMLGQIGMTNCV